MKGYWRKNWWQSWVSLDNGSAGSDELLSASAKHPQNRYYRGWKLFFGLFFFSLMLSVLQSNLCEFFPRVIYINIRSPSSIAVLLRPWERLDFHSTICVHDKRYCRRAKFNLEQNNHMSVVRIFLIKISQQTFMSIKVMSQTIALYSGRLKWKRCDKFGTMKRYWAIVKCVGLVILTEWEWTTDKFNYSDRVRLLMNRFEYQSVGKYILIPFLVDWRICSFALIIGIWPFAQI